jgi:NADPH2:quinone reductase
MRAYVTAPDGPDPVELREVADPEPADGEALVAVHAVSLNRGEIRMARTAPEGRPWGWDFAGEVVRAAADGRGPGAGTPVFGLVRRGAWAERVAVPTHQLAVRPDGLSASVAATLPVAGLTAYRTLLMTGNVAGRRVVVTGAAGGVGRFAVQLAAHWGATVTAVVGRPERGAGLVDLGAAEVVVGMPDDGEFDVILESVGGSSLATALGSVTPDGVIVTFGNSSQEPTTFDVSTFYRRSCARLVAFQIFTELDRSRSAARDLATLAELAVDGHLISPIGLEVPWEGGGRAMAALMDRSVAGKAVLTLLS